MSRLSVNAMILSLGYPPMPFWKHLSLFMLFYTFFEELKQMSPADCELHAIICYPSENSVTV